MSVQLWKTLKRKKYPILGTQWNIVGYSRCARNTFLVIPELRFALDAGLATDASIDTFFVTHAHMDHIGELFRYVIDPQDGARPTVYYPRPSKEYVESFLQSAVHYPTKEIREMFERGSMDVEEFVKRSIQMTKHNKNVPISWNPVTVSIPKDWPEHKPVIFGRIPLKNKKDQLKLTLELFRSTHTIATTGYGFIEERSGLLQEFHHLKGNQEAIEALKAQGVEVSGITQYAHFCYLGDTDHRVLYNSSGGWNEHIAKYRNVIMECTFLEDIDAKQAKEKKHALLSRILPFIRAHPHINFMLCHFSMKYKDKEVIDFFNRLNQPNIVPIVTDFDTLYTDTVADLVSEGNEYATDKMIETLRALGYSVEPPVQNKSMSDNTMLCVECSYIHEECTCHNCLPSSTEICDNCQNFQFECVCKTGASDT